MHLAKKLYAAVEKGDQDSVVSLIEAGANVDGMVNGKIDVPPLNLASARGDIEIVKILIEKGANPNKADTSGYGYTPLHRACEKDKAKIAAILIEQGADINARESNGQTPLHLACKGGHTQVVSLLIDYQADLNIADKFNILPLLVSIFSQKTEITKLLKNKGAKVFEPDNKKETWSYLAQPTHVVKAKQVIEVVLSQNLKETKPDAIHAHKQLSRYWDEILSLKKAIFCGITLFDMGTLKDGNKRMALSRHPEITGIVNQPNFIEKYPCHGNSIKENLKKGLDRHALIEELVKNGCLRNKAVRLNAYVERKVLSYLDDQDLESLNEAVNKPGVKTALAPTMQSDPKLETTLSPHVL